MKNRRREIYSATHNATRAAIRDAASNAICYDTWFALRTATRDASRTVIWIALIGELEDDEE